MQTLIENVNIINPFEEVKSSQNVLIEDNLIKEISSAKINSKENVEVIDGQDNYLLSGFIDCHCHIFAKGFHKEENMANPLGIHFYNAVPHALQTINAGVTSIRDCGSADLSFKLAQQRKLFTALIEIPVGTLPVKVTIDSSGSIFASISSSKPSSAENPEKLIRVSSLSEV